VFLHAIVLTGLADDLVSVWTGSPNPSLSVPNLDVRSQHFRLGPAFKFPIGLGETECREVAFLLISQRIVCFSEKQSFLINFGALLALYKGTCHG
jgi:hypothetical protein